MTHETDRKLEMRLVPAEGPADAQVLDDIIQLIRQGIATAHQAVPPISGGSQYHRPTTSEEQRVLASVEAKIKHRIEQASQESQSLVEKRAELAKRPDADQQLATEALKAAEQVVAAVQRALLRGVTPRVGDSEN